MFNSNDPFEILRYLLIAMGIEIQPTTNILVDQLTKSPLACDGKFLKANIDPNKALYISEHDIKLEPFDPKYTRVMERLFGRFLDVESSEEIGDIPDVLVYFFDKDNEEKKYRLTIKFGDGSRWVGNWYFNKIICFDEAILSIDGTFATVDLRPFDIPKDENMK